MFKRIINNLLGNSQDSMSTLSIQDVRVAIYELIAEHQTTTTLDVKNELRRRGFQAFQDQVSQMVNTIANEDNLAYRNNGKFNVYSFGSDTNESQHVYMEWQDEFWECMLDQKKLVLYSGKKGTDGTEQEFYCYKNCIAFREMNRLISENRQAGFRDAIDQRPPLAIRQKYGHLFGKKPTSCSIGYFNVVKKEYADNQIITKNAGYIFTWKLTTSRLELDKVLSQPEWSSISIKYTDAYLLGEKIIRCEPLTEYRNTMQLDVSNAHIFQVEIVFEDGEKAVFSKFQLDVQNALIPLVKRFLS